MDRAGVRLRPEGREFRAQGGPPRMPWGARPPAWSGLRGRRALLTRALLPQLLARDLRGEMTLPTGHERRPSLSCSTLGRGVAQLLALSQVLPSGGAGVPAGRARHQPSPVSFQHEQKSTVWPGSGPWRVGLRGFRRGAARGRGPDGLAESSQHVDAGKMWPHPRWAIARGQASRAWVLGAGRGGSRLQGLPAPVVQPGLGTPPAPSRPGRCFRVRRPGLALQPGAARGHATRGRSRLPGTGSCSPVHGHLRGGQATVRRGLGCVRPVARATVSAGRAAGLSVGLPPGASAGIPGPLASGELPDAPGHSGTAP